MKKLLVALLLPFLIAPISCQKKQAPAPASGPSPPASAPSEPAPQPPAGTPEEHEMHQGHKEVKIPTPLAQLQEAPLDVAQACAKSACSVLLLYADRLEVLDWQKQQTRAIRFPANLSAQIHSRAPAGKILNYANGYLILNSNLANPLYFNASLEETPGVYASKPDWLPLPEAGRNWFSLNDGRFYDFVLIPEKGIAAIDTDYRLNVADSGNLLLANTKTGATLALTASSIYTSSPTLPPQPDAILKFQRAPLQQIDSRTTDGEILDLCVTDLNQDGEFELLSTVITERGIFIEVQEPF